MTARCVGAFDPAIVLQPGRHGAALWHRHSCRCMFSMGSRTGVPRKTGLKRKLILPLIVAANLWACSGDDALPSAANLPHGFNQECGCVRDGECSVSDQHSRPSRGQKPRMSLDHAQPDGPVPVRGAVCRGPWRLKRNPKPKPVAGSYVDGHTAAKRPVVQRLICVPSPAGTDAVTLPSALPPLSPVRP